MEKPIRAIWWSRQKRYLPHPWGAMPKVRSPISHGAGRLASPAQVRQSSRRARNRFGHLGPAGEVEGVDAGRQLPQAGPTSDICD